MSAIPVERRASSVGRVVAVAAVLLAGLLASVPAGAGPRDEPQPAPPAADIDARWTPWLGCWELRQDRPPLPAPSGRPVADLIRSFTARNARAADGIRVCLVPAGPESVVTMTTIAEGQVVLEEAIAADGVRHEVDEPDCRGWRLREWSRDGRRLFTRAELACEGQARRSVTGVTLLAGDASWIDVQAVEIDGRENVRVRRYAPAASQEWAGGAVPADLPARAASDARRAAAAQLHLEDVIEAHDAVSAPALEAALLETGARFDLDSNALLALADAGVDASVIDLMVALSFSDRFVVGRADERATGRTAGSGGFPGLFDPMAGPVLDPFWYPYYVAPFGYAYGWSRYDPFFGTVGGRPLLLLPTGDEPAATPGRAVEGRGYTRVRARDEAANDDASRAAPRGTRPEGSRGGSGSSGGAAGGATASPQGYSGGGSTAGSESGSGSRSGSDSGRTASPRNREP